MGWTRSHPDVSAAWSICSRLRSSTTLCGMNLVEELSGPAWTEFAETFRGARGNCGACARPWALRGRGEVWTSGRAQVMSGSIRQRSAGSLGAAVRSSADPATGERKRVHRSFRGTKRQAQARLIELQSEAARGTARRSSQGDAWRILDRWDRDWVAINVSPKTRERWNQLRVNQIAPRLGGAPLQRIKPSHLAELYATLMREGGVGGKPLAPVTVGHCHRLLRRALGHALTWGLIQQNPAAVARPPRLIDTEIEIPTEIEIAAVLKHLRERDRQLYTLGLVALATGARRGELCGLCWKDFDAAAACCGSSVRSKRPRRKA